MDTKSIVTKGAGEIALVRFEVARLADAAGGDCYRVGISYGAEYYTNKLVKTIDEVTSLIKAEVEKRAA